MKRRQGAEQLAGSIPHYLYADAYQQEREKLKNYVHPTWTYDRTQAVCKRIAQVDGYRDENCANPGCKNCEQVSSEVMRCISAQRDCNRYGTGANGQRQG